MGILLTKNMKGIGLIVSSELSPNIWTRKVSLVLCEGNQARARPGSDSRNDKWFPGLGP